MCLPKFGKLENTFRKRWRHLWAHVTELDSSLKPTSRKQFLKLAYDLNKDSNVPRRFNKEIILQACFVSS